MKAITILTVLTFLAVNSFSKSKTQYPDTLPNYTEDSLIFEAPAKKVKGYKLDPAIGNAPTNPSKTNSKGLKLDPPLFGNIKVAGSSTGTGNPFVPKGYGSDPVDKYIYVLPQEFDPDGSKMQAARASYKETHKYDIDSPNVIVALLTLLIIITLFIFIRKGILKEEKNKITETSNVPVKQAVSNVSSTSSYKISYSEKPNK